MSGTCDHHRKMGFTFSVIGCPSCVALAATSSPAGNGEPLKCSDCGPYAPCPKHDEGTRDAAPGLREALQVAVGEQQERFRAARNTGAAAALSSVYAIIDRLVPATPPSEAPSGGLDPDRLRAAIASVKGGSTTAALWPSEIGAVAAEYARLSPTPGQGDGLRERLEAIPGLNAPGPDGQFRHWKPWDEIAAALATPAPDREP